ncbi:hypothetical protein ASPVEDRAFT_440864 [Aspergillus versicolor CBS 583.65]|uniref:Uncharacterized protein n=1 Tax=Aspergillus versicolor CBS 583.65 TaxID=1036611 RepID=A0A1L9P907_ASPVE|nr:uncharacterized protein ASPVEDRAFT_440864 [Aspergillus versicolor CBS 583.65]OJI98001.1 hypothetical protein ASPVEDRAFT_440864 [Aspergillus versicolor CBS 583.65]
MAEAFGAAVGVLTLLEQTIKTISKLRALREFIRTLPREMEDLIDESEIVQTVLISLQPEGPNISHFPSAERRLHAFQTSLESVILEISKHKNTVTGQRFGALKLILKKDVLRTYRQNLEYMKSTLSLLQQAHHSVSLYEIAAKFSREETLKEETTLTISEEPQHDPQKIFYQVERKKGHARDEYKRKFRFRTPLILIDKLWTISVTRAFSSWGFNLQVNSVIPFSSPVLTHCWRGEITEIQRLFSAGLASPFDCDPDGWSLLHVAAVNHDLDLCRFLLQAGADPGHRDNLGVTSIRIIDLKFPKEPESSKSLFLELYKLFIAYAEEELFENYWLRPNGAFDMGFNGPAEALSLIQSHHFERYSELPLGLRWERAMAVRPWVGDPRPLAIRIALGGGDSIDPAAFRMETYWGETLLHRIAHGMACAHATKRTDAMAEWCLLLAEAISASADLSQLAWYGQVALSPLHTFLLPFGAELYRNTIRRTRPLDDILCIWVSALKHAGVDLEAYGADEQALLKDGHFSFYLRVRNDLRQKYQSNDKTLWGKVLGLEYGPEPEDWHIFITNPVDEYVGEFWESVQRGLEVMPGTWVD